MTTIKIFHILLLHEILKVVITKLLPFVSVNLSKTKLNIETQCDVTFSFSVSLEFILTRE